MSRGAGQRPGKRNSRPDVRESLSRCVAFDRLNDERVSFDCNGSAAQLWQLNLGQTAVRLANTNFCLDAGQGMSIPPSRTHKRLVNLCNKAPTNGTQMKIWECFADLPAQEWFLTSDARIALLNQGTV